VPDAPPIPSRSILPGEPGVPARPRLAVFVPVFGIPSEIWAVRQCLGFQRFDPVVIAWERHPAAPADNHGLTVRTLDLPWATPRNLWRRVRTKLGQAETGGSGEERRRIAAVLRELQPEAVLCHFAWTGVRVAEALRGEAGGDWPPLVWHAHGRDVSQSLQYPPFRRALRSALPQSAAVVAVGRHQLARLEANGLAPGAGRLIPCGVPYADFAVRPRPVRNGPSIRFISIGRVSREKGAIESVRAFAHVRAHWPEAEFVLVGDGPDLGAARTLAGELGVQDSIRFTGVLGSEAVARECAEAHVFVQHSREIGGWVEGFGVSVTEAMAAGLAPVVSASGGILDQVEHEANGLLFPPDDVEAQGEAMLRLAKDEALRARLAEAARVSAARYDTVKQIAELESVLLEQIRPSHRA